jgi:hypothetical protein
MASSETEICNLALTRIGHRQITSLSENEKAANLCTLHYPRTRDALLRAHPWNFAIRYAELSQLTTTPAFEFQYAYQLPVACLKVIRTRSEQLGYDYPYRVVGREVWANTETMAIEYVARIEDVSQYDELFVDLLAQRLAAELAFPITDNRALTETAWQVYQTKLVEARLMDAQEGTPREIVSLDPWLAARL